MKTTTSYRVVRTMADGTEISTRAYSKGVAKRIRARALSQDPTLTLRIEAA